MSAPWICGVFVLFLLLGAPVIVLILRDEAAKRREWRPAGYTPGPTDRRAVVSDWWNRPLPSIALAQTVRPIDAPPAAELVSVADPRIVRTNRHLSAPTNGVGSAPRRARAERVRRVTKARKAARSRGAA